MNSFRAAWAHHRHGVALIIVMSVLALLSVIAVTFIFSSNLDKAATDNFTTTVLAQMSSESGIEYGLARLQDLPGGPLDAKTARQFGISHSEQSAPAFAKTLTLGEKTLQVSGVLGGEDTLTSTYSLRIIDESGKLNLNDSNLPMEHGVSATYKEAAKNGRLYLICNILADILFEGKGEAVASALFLDEEIGRPSYGGAQFPNMASVAQCLHKAGLTNDEIKMFGNYVTLYSWRDPNTLRTGLPVRKGELDEIVDLDFHTWLDFQTWAYDAATPEQMLDPRCPVNVNTARVELIQALIQPLQGVYLEEGPGETLSGEHYGFWSARQNNPTLSHDDRIGTVRATSEFNPEQARRLAQAIYDRVHGNSNSDLNEVIIFILPPTTGGDTSANPFETWDEFRHFLANGLSAEAVEAIFVSENFTPPQEPSFNGADTELFWKNYYADVQRDMLFANFNPNTLFNDFNPNSNVNLKVDKAQLAMSTAEFCFEPSGYFMLDSTGVVYDALGATVASHSIHTVVKLFETLRITSQAQFMEGLEKAEDITNYFNETWDEAANDFSADYEYPAEFSFWKGWFRPHAIGGMRAAAKKNWDVAEAKRPALQSYPEPLLPDRESYIANSLFDGQLMLATWEATNYKMTQPQGRASPNPAHAGRVYSGSFGQLQAHFNGSPDAANVSEPLNLSRVRRHTKDWSAGALNSKWDRYDIASTVEGREWHKWYIWINERGLISFRADNQPYFAAGSPAILKTGANKPHSGPLTSFDPLGNDETPGNAYPDGAYSEKNRTLAYQIGHNFDSFYHDAYKGRSGWVQFWIKPRFDVGNSSVIRKFFAGPTRQGGKPTAHQTFASLYYFANHTSAEEDGHGATRGEFAWEKLDHNSRGADECWIPRNSIAGGWAWRSIGVDKYDNGYPITTISGRTDGPELNPALQNNEFSDNFILAHHTSFSVTRDHALGRYTNQALGDPSPDPDILEVPNTLYNNFSGNEWNLLSISWDFTGFVIPKAFSDGSSTSFAPGPDREVPNTFDRSRPPHCTISINGKNLHAGDQYGWIDQPYWPPATTNVETVSWFPYAASWEVFLPAAQPSDEHRLFCGSKYNAARQFKAAPKLNGNGSGGSTTRPPEVEQDPPSTDRDPPGTDKDRRIITNEFANILDDQDGKETDEQEPPLPPDRDPPPPTDEDPPSASGDYIDFSNDYFRFGELPRGTAPNTDYSTPYYADSTIDEVVGGSDNLFTEHTAYWNRIMFYGGRYFNLTYNDLGDIPTLATYTSPKIEVHKKLGVANEPLTLRSVAWTYYRAQTNRAPNTDVPKYPTEHNYELMRFDPFMYWQQNTPFPEMEGNLINLKPLNDSFQNNVRGVSVNPADTPDPMAEQWATDTDADPMIKQSWDAVSVDFRKPESAQARWVGDGWYFEETDSDDDDTYTHYNDRFTYAGGSTFRANNRSDATYNSNDTLQLKLSLHLDKGQQLYSSPVIDDITVTFKLQRPTIKVWESSTN